LVVVGDVHGCAAELAELFDRVALATDDRVVLVGDLVLKGPDSGGVMKLVRALGAQSVRGNHDERLLSLRAANELSREPEVAAQLDDADWRYLAALPLWLDCPELRVVHAGLEVGVPIEEQAPRTLLTTRTIDPQGRASDARDGGKPWGALYQGPPHVVFGHNALPEPQVHAWATGLDTGCVYGGRLTALVLPAGADVPPPADRRDALVSVPARRAHAPLWR
jgi:hypothetical protein